jgi:hypothetical protein
VPNHHVWDHGGETPRFLDLCVRRKSAVDFSLGRDTRIVLLRACDAVSLGSCIAYL